MSGPVEQFKSLQSTSDFLFVVYFRGHWCPFCQQYLKSLESISSSIITAGGKPVIITAEASEHLSTTRSKTGYSGEAIVDTENILAKDLKTRGLLDVAISAKGGYPHGMAQPAVLVITRESRVLYNWAIVPGVMNLGGAKDRPCLSEIWEDVEAELSGKQAVHKGVYTKQTFLQGFKTKIFG